MQCASLSIWQLREDLALPIQGCCCRKHRVPKVSPPGRLVRNRPRTRPRVEFSSHIFDVSPGIAQFVINIHHAHTQHNPQHYITTQILIQGMHHETQVHTRNLDQPNFHSRCNIQTHTHTHTVSMIHVHHLS